MPIQWILFDLDGTLLPMDQNTFVNSYFQMLTAKLAPFGYDPKEVVKGIWAGTDAMVRNDGGATNEEVFWKVFSALLGERALAHKPLFEEFYRNEFQAAAAFCGFTPAAKETVDALKQMGYRVGLATNPLFPTIATEHRIRWAGMQPEDFEFYTTYESCRFCKPNPRYYEMILEKIGCPAEQCLMVGNDVEEDAQAATKVGMQVFLITDCLINKGNVDISAYPHGSFAELLEFVPKRG